jgi:branched-chain amino acid transport system permease protein
MQRFFELLVNGVTLGSVYGLIALGYSIVYGILQLLNFAHGDVLMVGAFVGFFVLEALGGAANPVLPVGLVILIMFVAGMASSGILGVAIERVAYRPLRSAPRIAPLISSLGVSLLLENLAILYFGASIRSYNTFELAGGALFSRGVDIGRVHISLIRILVVGVTLVLLLIFVYLVRSTMLGKSMRATAHDREAAAMMGIDVDRVVMFAFLLGSALAGAGGVMLGLAYNDVYSYLGFTAGLYGFTAAVIGGIGSLPGSVFGGLAVGLLQAFASGYLPQGSTFQDFWVFLFLIAALLVRPTGIFGRSQLQKV